MHQAVPPALSSLVPSEASPGTSIEASIEAAGSSLSWTVHPAAADPPRAAMLVAILAVASTLAFEFSGSAVLGILAFLMLALSLRAWFLPRHYTLDAAGAHESGPLCADRHLPWGEVRKVARGRFGLYLATMHNRSRFVRDRGLFLRTVGGRTSAPNPVPAEASRALDRDAVLRFVEGAAANP